MDIRMLPEIMNETIQRFKPVVNLTDSNIDALKGLDMEKPYMCCPTIFLSEDIRLQRGDRHRQHLCHPSLSEFLVLTPGVHLLPHENLLYKAIRIQLYPAHRETDSKR